MTTKVTLDNLETGVIANIAGVPFLTRLEYLDSDNTKSDDVALGLDGGNIKISGYDFANITVKLNDTTIDSANVVPSGNTNAIITLPAASAGSYNLTLINNDTQNISIIIGVITYSSFPAWSTEATLPSTITGESFTVSLAAPSDSNVVYTLATGSSLPTGVTLAANGLLTGSITVETSTTYTFSVVATDAENQNTPREFSITIIPPDEFFAQTSLLLNGDDNNTFITDASDNQFTITPVADTRPSAFSPYGPNWSVAIDGSDYLEVTQNADLAFQGGGAFTWETFINMSTGGIMYGSYTGPSNSGGSFTFSCDSTNKNFGLGWIINGTDTWNFDNYSDNNVLTLGRWHHIAASYDGAGTLRYFVDGVLVTTRSVTVNVDTMVYNVRIGRSMHPSYPVQFVGNFSNMRFVKGYCLYTENFTAPTTTLTAVTGTVFLAFTTNRHTYDASTVNNTIAVSGTPLTSSFGPFTDTDTSTGSGYFDGSGDYLTVPDSVNFDLPGDFTAEFYAYATGSNARRFFNIGDYRAGNNGLLVYSTTGNAIVVYINGAIVITGPTLIPYQWVHVACVREGSGTNNLKLYVNGELAGQVTNTVSFTGVAGNGLVLGAEYNGSFAATLETYISNFRLVKGTALYTEAFTPPTSPLTAVSGTQLLTLQNRIGYNNSQPIDESGTKSVVTRSGNAAAGSLSPVRRAGYSAYFNATNVESYLLYNVPISFTGTSTETIEFDIYLEDLGKRGASSADTAFSCFSFGSYTTGLFCSIGTNGGVGYYFRSNQTFSVVSGPAGTISPGQWYSVKMENVNGSLNLYVDGTLVAGPIALFGNVSYTGVQIGRFIYGAGSIFNSWSKGYIRNFKITKDNTVLLHALRENNFLDSGPFRYAPTLVETNGVITMTPFTGPPYEVSVPDGYSMYFDKDGDYLSLPDNDAFELSNGDFTWESWIYLDKYATASTGGYYTASLINKDDNNARSYNIQLSGTASSWTSIGLTLFSNNSTAVGTNVNYNFQLYTWYHVAVVRSSGVVRMYVDGVDIGGGDNATTAQNTAAGLTIGSQSAYWSGQGYPYPFPGYMSNWRLVKGVAVYTSEFTPPTEPLTAISGTSLLTCQDPTVIDNSTNSFAITVNGNSQPSKFNPFGETTTSYNTLQYTPSLDGGSVYFDGTGDYLKVPHSEDLTFRNGDFTIEFWLYLPGSSIPGSGSCFLTKGWGSYAPFLFYSNGTSMVFYASSNGSSWDISSAQVIGALKLRTWMHICVSRQGTSIKGFMDGVQGFSITSSATLYVNTSTVTIAAADNGGSPINGYYSGIRMIKGRSIYNNQAFVPSTAPLERTRDTVLLINGTNAAIQDKTGRNVLETVGDTRLLPESAYRVNKSVYFDGSSLLNIPASNDNTIGTQACMVEAWVYRTAATTGYVVCSHQTGGMFYFSVSSTGIVGWALNHSGGSSSTSSGPSSVTAVPLNTWTHIAGVRKANSTEMRIYINGQLDVTGALSATNVGSYGGAKAFYIGAGPDKTSKFTGYLNSVRYVLGDEVYTSNFTPPTAPPDVITGTRFLVAHDKQWIDESGNFTYSREGTPLIQSKGPFTETQTSDNAMYFDGTGDYLASTFNTVNSPGSGDFTIEAWLYNLGYSGSQYGRGWVTLYSAAANTRLMLRLDNASDKFNMYLITGGTQRFGISGTLSTGICTPNSWVHAAFVRQSGTFKLYINGTLDTTISGVTVALDNFDKIEVGRNQDGTVPEWKGYIDDLRITKGVARYTENFTPPTIPYLTI